jgi:tape measure domain-containing protein
VTGVSVSSQITVRDAASRRLERIADRYARVERAARAADTATNAAGRNTAEYFDRASRSVQNAADNVNDFSRRQQDAERQASMIGDVWQRIKGYIGAAGAAFSLSKLVGLSDTLAGNKARLELIVDDGGSVDELNKKIYASAMRARASYTDTAATISKLGLLAGDAFNSNDEMIAFTELMNKNFTIGGASTQEQSSAMYQLTQAMASGRLQGDEYRSIIENAPLLAKAIEDYMRNVQGAEGAMKDWSSEGLLTADVIKAALFSTADEVEERFAKMPMKWGQVWTMASNIAIRALNPLLSAINWVANNISVIGPVVLGLGTAFLVFQVAAHWTQIASAAMGIYNGLVNFLTIGYGVLTGSTAAASAAQFTYNSALLASPVTWVVMMLAVLVAALYAGVAAFNKFTGSGVSATGILMGAFAVLGAHVLNNTIIPLQNGFAMFANFIGNLFNDPVAAVKVLFYDMALTVLGYISKMASGIETLINKIPGVTVDITSGLDSFYAKLESAQQKVKDKSGWVEYVKKMDYIDYSKAAGAGYRFGEGLADKVSGMFSGSDYAGLGDIAGGVSDIAANTGKIADEVHIADEDLQFFRDVAEMRYIQNFVTLTPTVSMSASISEKVDVNGVIQKIEQVLKEEIAESAEVVLA